MSLCHYVIMSLCHYTPLRQTPTTGVNSNSEQCTFSEHSPAPLREYWFAGQGLHFVPVENVLSGQRSQELDPIE